MIPRIAYFETIFLSKEYLGRKGLDTYFGNKHVNELIRYKIKFNGLIVQEEGNTTLHLIKPGETIYFLRDNRIYCRWHDGPFNEKGVPVKRKYCIREANNRTGYCINHRDSLKAYYSMCFESMSIENLRYCWLLDEKIEYKIEYAVYLLLYSSNGLKVGSTRYWRRIERIGEQPHVLAIILYRFNSAVKTREIESKIGRLEGLSEVPRRSLRDSINTPIYPAINKIMYVKEKIEKKIGVNTEDNTPFRIEPEIDISYYVKARETSLEYLFEKPLEIINYYMGYILLSDKNTNNYYIIKINRILHRNMLKII